MTSEHEYKIVNPNTSKQTGFLWNAFKGKVIYVYENNRVSREEFYEVMKESDRILGHNEDQYRLAWERREKEFLEEIMDPYEKNVNEMIKKMDEERHKETMEERLETLKSFLILLMISIALMGIIHLCMSLD